MSRRNLGRFDLLGALCIVGSLVLPLIGWALIRADDQVCAWVNETGDDE